MFSIWLIPKMAKKVMATLNSFQSFLPNCLGPKHICTLPNMFQKAVSALDCSRSFFPNCISVVLKEFGFELSYISVDYFNIYRVCFSLIVRAIYKFRAHHNLGTQDRIRQKINNIVQMTYFLFEYKTNNYLSTNCRTNLALIEFHYFQYASRLSNYLISF